MKKKLIPILVCLILAASLALVGCGGDSFSRIKVTGTQNYDYTVYSNGGMAVQYGNYVYFINGTSGYEDTDGKQNSWPNVIKGGLYRAELSGTAGSTKGEFVISANPDAANGGFEFVSTVETDSEGNKSDVVNVQRIAPKRIGTSGYANGGIFIYDNWVYFASPNNEKNKSGNVQTTKTDFFRAKLDGSDSQKIYTTSKSGNESNPYAFYKYNGAVYLVAQDGTDLISVKVGKKPGNKVTIAQNVTSVVLPYSETYYKGMSENTLNHFVYVLRAVGDKDSQKTGNVIEVMRPDGKEGGVLHSQEKADTIEAVRDGLLFYRTTDDSNNTLIKFNSLHDFLMDEGNDISPSYRAYHSRLASYVDEYGNYLDTTSDEQKAEYEANARVQFDGTLLSTKNASDYTSTYCFRPAGERSDLVYMLGIKSDSVELRSNLKIEADLNAVTVCDEAITYVGVKGGYLYFTADNILYRTAWDKKAGDKSDEEKRIQVSDDAVTANNFNGDYCAGYIVYTADVNSLADGYTFFRKINGPEGSKATFVGRIISDDKLAAPSISLKSGEITWSAVDNATSYNVYYTVDGGESVLAADGISATSYTVSQAESGNYTYWVVAQADDVVSAKSNTVTHKV